MKYIIDGKPAYLIAKENGISIYTFFRRVHLGWSVKDAATRQVVRGTSKYIIRKYGCRKVRLSTTEQVAKYLGTSKGTICGLFFRKGSKIELFGYTIERRGRRETKKDSNL